MCYKIKYAVAYALLTMSVSGNYTVSSLKSSPKTTNMQTAVGNFLSADKIAIAGLAWVCAVYYQKKFGGGGTGDKNLSEELAKKDKKITELQQDIEKKRTQVTHDYVNQRLQNEVERLRNEIIEKDSKNEMLCRNMRHMENGGGGGSREHGGQGEPPEKPEIKKTEALKSPDDLETLSTALQDNRENMVAIQHIQNNPDLQRQLSLDQTTLKQYSEFITDQNKNLEKRRKNLVSPEQGGKITLDDVQGMADVKEKLLDILNLTKSKKKRLGFMESLPKGYLLYGPPGTGKTYIVKALANSANMNFISISGPEFRDKYLGESAKKVRKAFSDAISKEPCILFIDEIDALGSREGEIHDEARNAINQVLTEMTDLDNSKKVVVIGATNTPWLVDNALQSRLKVKIEIPLMSDKESLEFLKFLANKFPMDIRAHQYLEEMNKTLNIRDRRAMQSLYAQAMQISERHGHELILKSDLEEATDEINPGKQKKEEKFLPWHLKPKDSRSKEEIARDEEEKEREKERIKKEKAEKRRRAEDDNKAWMQYKSKSNGWQ